jgi:hypothetical protein
MLSLAACGGSAQHAGRDDAALGSGDQGALSGGDAAPQSDGKDNQQADAPTCSYHQIDNPADYPAPTHTVNVVYDSYLDYDTSVSMDENRPDFLFVDSDGVAIFGSTAR